jgi:hypothetical protein
VNKTVVIAAALVVAWAAPEATSAAERIKVGLEVHVEGPSTAGGIEDQLRAGVQHGLEALGDVEIVTPDAPSARMLRILAASGPAIHSASVIVTERYDRETLMVLGVEDDDLAATMMALHIVNGHWIFTGTDVGDVAKRIVAAVDSEVLSKSRAPKRPQ